jgi:hypothetical protein
MLILEERDMKPVAHNFVDRTGTRFGTLTVIGRAPTRRRRKGKTWKTTAMWYVRCDCGNQYSIPSSNVGKAKTCFRCKYNSKSIFAAGDKVGCLLILERCPANTVGKSYTTYKCKCECGKFRYMTIGHLKERDYSTCGCGFERHGFASKKPENRKANLMYRLWFNIKDRCLNPRCKSYKHYGGKGVRLCERWMTFTNFLADMKYKPEGCSIDRIDPDGDYSPDNCRWANNRTQSLNRGFNKVYRFHGETMTLAQWVARIQLEGEMVSLPAVPEFRV